MRRVSVRVSDVVALQVDGGEGGAGGGKHGQPSVGDL